MSEADYACTYLGWRFRRTGFQSGTPPDNAFLAIRLNALQVPGSALRSVNYRCIDRFPCSCRRGTTSRPLHGWWLDRGQVCIDGRRCGVTRRRRAERCGHQISKKIRQWAPRGLRQWYDWVRLCRVFCDCWKCGIRHPRRTVLCQPVSKSSKNAITHSHDDGLPIMPTLGRAMDPASGVNNPPLVTPPFTNGLICLRVGMPGISDAELRGIGD